MQVLFTDALNMHGKDNTILYFKNANINIAEIY